MNNAAVLSFLFIFFSFVCFSRLSLANTLQEKGGKHAWSPPRGWNSYDSFSWIISEEEFLKNAEIVSQRLRSHGYEYVVIDYLWYRRKVEGAYTDSLGFDVIDEWGRMAPDPGRWPSSRGGKGFTEVAKKVHQMGLKFGFHVMRGISTQAVNANTPILDSIKGGVYKEAGRHWTAKDIALTKRACKWMPHGFMSVNASLGAGRAFLRSLYTQYAEWGVDFDQVKHDCVFGDDLDVNEIKVVSEVLKGLDRSVVYSLSPGTSVTPAMAKKVLGLVNMYRITGDDWDTWGDVAAHFNISRDLSSANMIGAEGLLGKSWPDMDMLPLGTLTDPGSNEGPHRKGRLTLDEQRTQMTLWSMVKSPLMFGGDMRDLDDHTYRLLTNPILMEIDSFSSNNKEFPLVTALNGSGTRNKSLSQEIRKYQKKLDKSDAPVLGLNSCEDSKPNGWSIKNLDQDLPKICWNDDSRSRYQAPFCLYKRKLPSESDAETIYDQNYQGKHHLLATDRMELCLDASPKRKLTAKEFNRGSFSPCKRDANQMWVLNNNGTLLNTHSGLCANLNAVQAISGGIRSWIATGRKGEIYLAFFNLNSEKTTISAKVSDLHKALPGRNLVEGSCKGTEIWSGKELGTVGESVSMPVERHASALFILHCISPL